MINKMNWIQRIRTIAKKKPKSESDKQLEEVREPLFKRICKIIPEKKEDRDDRLRDLTYFSALILIFAGCAWQNLPGIGLILVAVVLLFTIFRTNGGQ